MSEGNTFGFALLMALTLSMAGCENLIGIEMAPQDRSPYLERRDSR